MIREQNLFALHLQSVVSIPVSHLHPEMQALIEAVDKQLRAGYPLKTLGFSVRRSSKNPPTIINSRYGEFALGEHPDACTNIPFSFVEGERNPFFSPKRTFFQAPREFYQGRDHVSKGLW